MDEPVDLIVSTATFHWILDHERLFARLYAALRPGGRLVAQCGGAGNIAGTLAVADSWPARRPSPSTWPACRRGGPSRSRRDRRAAGGRGIEGARAWLEEAPAAPDLDAATEFLATVVLRCHLERLSDDLGAAGSGRWRCASGPGACDRHLDLLPEDLRPGFARDVAARCARPDGASRSTTCG